MVAAPAEVPTQLPAAFLAMDKAKRLTKQQAQSVRGQGGISPRIAAEILPTSSGVTTGPLDKVIRDLELAQRQHQRLVGRRHPSIEQVLGQARRNNRQMIDAKKQRKIFRNILSDAQSVVTSVQLQNVRINGQTQNITQWP